MTDWTDPRNILEHVQDISKETQLPLIDTEPKKRLTEAEIKFETLMAELKAWNDKQKALIEGKA